MSEQAIPTTRFKGGTIRWPTAGGADNQTEVDVFLSGLLFFDIVFAGLVQPPTPGTEVWTRATGSGPGGIATFAVALSRFGMRTSPAATFGDACYGEHCRPALIRTEGVNLTWSRRFARWATPSWSRSPQRYWCSSSTRWRLSPSRSSPSRPARAVRPADRDVHAADTALAGPAIPRHGEIRVGGAVAGVDRAGGGQRLRHLLDARRYITGAVQDELLDAARLDGCGFFRQYRHVALPVIRPGLAFLGTYTFIAAWNDYVWSLIVLVDRDRLTLQVALSQLNRSYGQDYSMIMVGALLSVLPLVIMFTVFARGFTADAVEGAVRG